MQHLETSGTLVLRIRRSKIFALNQDSSVIIVAVPRYVWPGDRYYSAASGRVHL